jgi:putative transposase
MELTKTLSAQVGINDACRSLTVSRATFYRSQQPPEPTRPKRAPRSARALTAAERAETLSVLHSEEFVDRAPAAVCATLLDQGRYLCSPRTMYRLLSAEGEVRERRNQLTHPHYQAPELLATAPNQVWSWDITKLRGAVKWTYYYLYVVLDIFSRYVTGWMVATRESAELAKQLLLESCLKQGIALGQLIVHSDRGSSMTSKPVALLLADLGVTRSLSRPHVSNDNPFSEAQFNTLKYCPQFPARFGSIEDGRAFGQVFFPWYNQVHRHSGLGFLTPAVVHFGHAATVRAHRQQVLALAYAAHPERFVKGRPQPADLPTAVWINPPPQRTTTVAPDDLRVAPILDAVDHVVVTSVDRNATLITPTLVVESKRSAVAYRTGGAKSAPRLSLLRSPRSPSPPFLLPAHRTGRADFPHPALGRVSRQDMRRDERTDRGQDSGDSTPRVPNTSWMGNCRYPPPATLCRRRRKRRTV